MRRFAILLGLLLLTAQVATAADLWIHMRIVKNDFRQTRVRMNLPLSAIEKMLPLIPADDDLDNARIEIDGYALTAEELSSAVDALRSAKAGEHVKVASWNGTFDASREGDELVIVAARERTTIRIPFALAESSARDGEIDVRAMARAVVQRGAGNVMTIVSDDARIDMWVDATPSMR